MFHRSRAKAAFLLFACFVAVPAVTAGKDAAARPSTAKRLSDKSLDFRPMLESLYQSENRAWAFKANTPAELSAWRKETRTRLAGLLGIEGEKRFPLNLKQTPLEGGQGFSLRRLTYNTRPDLRASAYLVLPARGKPPYPVVLCPPGHGQGARQLLTEAGGMYRQYPLHLALNGIAALVPDNAGMGERILPGVTYQVNHHYFYSTLLSQGKSPMGYMVWDLMRALDAVSDVPELDPKRVGCWGLSLGGALTLYLAALDERVRAACVSGYLTSIYDRQVRAAEHDWAHCGCTITPGMSSFLEHQDLAGLICPRPLLVESGAKDVAFPSYAARETVDALRKTYLLAGEPGNLSFMESPGGHELYFVLPTVEWFRENLSAAGEAGGGK